MRFRDSWFIKAGIAIVAFSALPIALATFMWLVFSKDFDVGPIGIWFFLGAGLGCLWVLLGVVGVFVRKSHQRTDPK